MNLGKKEVIVISMIVLILTLWVGFTFFHENPNDIIIETLSDERQNEETGAKDDIVVGGNDNNDIIVNNENLNQETSEEIIVDVCGAVHKPGIVKLVKGSRVADAVALSGGLLESVDRKKVNLARFVEDGEQVYIPEIGENIEPKDFVSNDISHNNLDGIININKASQVELETLNGIGQVLAQRIVTYREENGEFKSIDSIMKVSGIGTKKFEDIKDKISIK